jgi:NADH-quinone oxidoreductase subunit C
MDGIMDDLVQKACTAAHDRFGAELREFRQQSTLVLAVDKILDAARMLRDEFQFNMLLDVTSVDYMGEEPRFHVVYQLYSLTNQKRLSLRVPVSGQNPHLPTIEGIFPGANWYEREVMDLMGIRFEGHSDPRRIIMPADWQGHPLRKDFPLGYEEVQFTFNIDEINLSKPKGKEV